MAPPVVLHVGTMKSGTTYLQRRLGAHREALLAHGVLFPGRTWSEQVHAVGDLLGRGRMGGQSEKRNGAWQRLVEQVLAHSGPSLVSMELLGAAGPARVEEVVQSFPGRDVHVVVTARDLNRTLLAMWQEGLQNARTIGWDDYRDAVQDETGIGRRFWREHDLVRVAGRWTAQVPPERFTLVTVPPPGAPSELLWQRFSAATGLDPRWCGPVAPSNESLGAASAAVLLELNRLLEDRHLPWSDYHVLVKRTLAKGVLAGRRGEEPPLGLPVARWLKHRAREMVQGVEGLGIRVVGDLADLTPVPVPGTRPGNVSSDAALRAALAGLAGLVAAQTAPEENAALADPATRILEAVGA